jgi:hypothetical protein
MSPRRTLILASFAFALLWTAGMCWWNAPMPRASMAVLAVIGAIEGFVWFWAMRVCLTWAGLLAEPKPVAVSDVP